MPPAALEQHRKKKKKKKTCINSEICVTEQNSTTIILNMYTLHQRDIQRSDRHYEELNYECKWGVAMNI